MTTLFFDIGNVLVTFDFSKAMRRLAADSPLSAAEVELRLRPLIVLMEEGRMSTGEFLARGRDVISFAGSEESFVAAYCDIFEENVPMVRLVERLADRVPLYLLSNTSGLHLDYLRAAFPVFAHFRGGAFSHEAGSAKPDSKIYRDLIALSGCDPAQTLYLDDAPANTAAGSCMGLHVFTYDWRNHAALEAALPRWLQPAPTP
ncbi:MAG: HAD family hydrolase [Verrucomicrobiales bacterium]